ncbi:MAG TPA: hypothetical protein VMG08_01630 [Allosphingosinicella sp.]|nr:hypothetical protein [Allosphingosinicella sp.]
MRASVIELEFFRAEERRLRRLRRPYTAGLAPGLTMRPASIRARLGTAKIWLVRAARSVGYGIWRWVKSIRSWTGQAWFVVVTIILALLGYWQWRYNNVLQLQTRWASAEMLVRHERLNDALNCRFIPTYLQQDPRQPADPVEQMAFASNNYIGIEPDLTAYIEFFAEVEMCIDTSLCDPTAACRRFAPAARALQSSYRPTLAQVRRVTGNYSFGGEFERVGRLCEGYWDPPVRPERRGRTREENAEVERTQLQLIQNRGPAAFRRDQACERMTPARQQSQRQSAQ